MDNVIDLGIITKANVPPDYVLKKAVGKLTEVVVIGYDKDGEEFFASSVADGGDVLWLLKRCEIALMRMAEANHAEAQSSDK